MNDLINYLEDEIKKSIPGNIIRYTIISSSLYPTGDKVISFDIASDMDYAFQLFIKEDDFTKENLDKLINIHKVWWQ